MSISTKLIGKKILLLSALIMIGMALFPFRVMAGEASCLESGMTVSNQTMRDLWVTGNGGRCFLWKNHHLFKLNPGATVVIYRDMNCQTEYCPMSITFDNLILIDLDQNCRVRILPDCNLSDM